MKIFRHNITGRLLTCLMVSIISLMVTNKILFMHSHVLNDGNVVTHAHPFNKSTEKSSGKSHNHSYADLQFISSMDVLFFIVGLLITLILQNYWESLDFNRKNFFTIPFECFIPGRSPPLS